MQIATERNCSAPGSHCSFRFVTDASDLQIPPGTPPTNVKTTLGNGLDFVLVTYDEGGALYTQHLGCVELFVYND